MSFPDPRQTFITEEQHQALKSFPNASAYTQRYYIYLPKMSEAGTTLDIYVPVLDYITRSPEYWLSSDHAYQRLEKEIVGARHVRNRDLYFYLQKGQIVMFPSVILAPPSLDLAVTSDWPAPTQQASANSIDRSIDMKENEG